MKNKLNQLKNTKTLMIISAIFLAVNGFGFTFFPNEIAGLLINDDNYIFILILQMLGALYLGFSILNWMSKGGSDHSKLKLRFYTDNYRGVTA